MTHAHRHLKRILTGTAILLITCLFAKAQTIAEVISDSDNSVVFRIENIDTKKSPNRIVLVYDSNLITLETETKTTSRLFNQKVTYTSKSGSYSAESMFASALAVEFEGEQEIEDWMMEPFATRSTPEQYAKADAEAELVIEEWMYDLNNW